MAASRKRTLTQDEADLIDNLREGEVSDALSSFSQIVADQEEDADDPDSDSDFEYDQD